MLALGVVYVVWGSSYLAMRYLVSSAPPMVAAGARFLVAGLLLAAILSVVSGPAALRMRPRWLGSAALTGLLLPALGSGLVAVAERHVASGLAALLVACVPLFVVLLRWSLGERPPVGTVFGVVVGLVGLAVLVTAGDGHGGTHGTAWWGPALVVVAALAWAVGSVASVRLPVSPDPFAQSAAEMVFGGGVLVAAGLVAGERITLDAVSASSWWAWLYLVTFGSVLAFTAHAVALRTLPLSTVSTYAYVNPVVAVGLGVAVAGERLLASQMVGGGLVVVAVALLVGAEARRVTPATANGTAIKPGIGTRTRARARARTRAGDRKTVTETGDTRVT
ncbi:EamA domain-containing membrane protein RarD [Streptoalloteichus tenebrarius]|uniref:EamA domain-containing membrane protein RarD n=2 Tax=Streptoalloteichus tenebrarius (strain ATCC 17920 / DSM 40477 / JCM 4838 / CBS 697.72 / NBRC 16177 / NCIMB 11028 / NRRL B-12390 / A12253. 1 / ISP 5477) TaxID=1933 RepID=A0ABT1HN48_STRSD|nr:EamA domain-containing membrane protein RarD [Streptoalloteichus tenebrarius]